MKLEMVMPQTGASIADDAVLQLPTDRRRDVGLFYDKTSRTAENFED